ncbi:T9SS type A sorting domain-containing protein, partial [Cryomorphaceae bacterium 1068]|nr:T9SS type A sorting domain-containing protein [Cryomorphaceae bacterium 1068]
NYTITLDCYETLSGSVTVECIGGGQGVSVFAIPVEIVLDTEVTLEEGNILISSATGVTYQWIDCATEEPIEGATNQFFVALEEGEYAVILTQNNCSATSECIPTSTPCESPYPDVNPESLNATILPNGKLRFEWEPISGQIGCQINILVGAGPQQASIIKPGPDASVFTAPVSQLVPFTTYFYRVRCGCSQNPLIVGQYTPYASVFYLPPTITEEMGDAYADSPLSQIDGDIQWSNASLGADIVSELFAMKASESWVRVGPNPAQDNVNLSYNSIKEGQGLIQVFDAQGKLAFEKVMTFNEGLNNVNLNLNELENGFYIVEVLKGESRESIRLLMQ